MALLVDSFIEKLIEEVEKRPPIYKNNLKEYSDGNLKKKLWEEICEVVVPDWNQLSADNKTSQGRDVQKKWGNLRTCFRRELNAQKNTKSGQPATKRRKYIYFEQLLFLLPCIENRTTESNLEEDDSQANYEEDDESGPSTSTPINHRKKRTNIQKRTDLDEALLKALNETNTVDEDTNFALSLVPSLRKLTAEQKLDAKIAILNVFKQITVARLTMTTTNSTTNYDIYQRGTNIWPPSGSIQTYVAFRTTSANLPLVQDIPPRCDSNETTQSYVSNFSDDSQIYEL